MIYKNGPIVAFVILFSFCLGQLFVPLSAANAQGVSSSDINPDVVSSATPASSSGTATISDSRSKTGSINPGANTGKSSQSSGAMMNAMASAALFASCFASKPPNYALCAMGALAAMQAAQDSKAANKSGNTSFASSYDPTSTTKETKNPEAGIGTGVFSDPKIAEGMKKFEAAGYKVASTGITNPDGSFTPSSAFNSPGSMAKAGLDPNAFAQAQAALAGINDAAGAGKVSSVAVADGVSGSGAGIESGDAASSGSDAGSGYGMKPFSLSADQKKSLLEGKIALLDGEPIGVKSQNIFDMVHAVYQRKAKANYFIEDSAPTASTPMGLSPGKRAPASTPKK